MRREKVMWNPVFGQPRTCNVLLYCLTSILTSAFNLSWSYIHFIRGSRVKTMNSNNWTLNLIEVSKQKTNSSLPVDTQDLTNISSRVTLLKPVTEPSSKEASLRGALRENITYRYMARWSNLQTYWPCCRRQKTYQLPGTHVTPPKHSKASQPEPPWFHC